MKSPNERYCDGCYWGNFDIHTPEEPGESMFRFISCKVGLEPCKDNNEHCSHYEPASRIWDVHDEMIKIMNDNPEYYLPKQFGSDNIHLKKMAEQRLIDRGELKM